MRNLLNVLIRYSSWFLFAFYVLISCLLLFSTNGYRTSVYLTSANSVSAAINGIATGTVGYFNLISVNRSLQQSNARLESRVFNLENELRHYKALAGDTATYIPIARRYGYTVAPVLNNSLRHRRNYITIGSGGADGIRPGMGVVNQSGVVGIVDAVGSKTARVISLLSEGQHFSVKLKGTAFVGTLSWRGTDPAVAYAEEIPRHARYHIGDTIVTSGFSSTFPEGIPVGVVTGRIHAADDNYFTLKLHLLPDFRNLSNVRVIKDYLKAEIDTLGDSAAQTPLAAITDKGR